MLSGDLTSTANKRGGSEEVEATMEEANSKRLRYNDLDISKSYSKRLHKKRTGLEYHDIDEDVDDDQPPPSKRPKKIPALQEKNLVPT